LVHHPEKREINDANDFIFYNTNGDGMTNEQYLNFLLMVGGGGPWSSVVNSFQTRVNADGGTLENYDCILNDVKFLMQNP